MIKSCKNTLSFIKRNIPKASRFVKNKCYITLIRPKAEYASPVWDPYYKVHIDNIEKIQKSAARYVSNNYVMESGNSAANLKTLGWDTLEERRLQTKLSIFQKGRLGDIDIPTDHLILKTRQTRRGGDGPIYQREFSSIDGHIYSFYPSTARLWNNLPLDLRLCTKSDSFANKLKTLNLSDLRRSLRSID